MIERHIFEGANHAALMLAIPREHQRREDCPCDVSSSYSLLRVQCDDGNTVDGDGCSSQCTTEPGWSCTSAGLGEPDACGGAATAPPEGATCDCPNGQVCALERTSGEPRMGQIPSSQCDVTLVKYFNLPGQMFALFLSIVQE
jgi:cysteine-rich repeat protein